MQPLLMLCALLSVHVVAWQTPQPTTQNNVSLSHQPTAKTNVSLSHETTAKKNVSSSPRKDPTAELGSMMADSQLSLAQAEAGYDKVVKVAKQNLSQLLSTQAKVLATKIGDYKGSLSNISAGLAQAANATRAGMAAVAAKSGPRGDPSFAEMEKQAFLRAKVDAAGSEARRLMRQQTTLQRQAVAQAMAQLEDAESQLTRKLGDLSAISNDPKAVVEAEAPDSEIEPVTADRATKNAPKVAKIVGKNTSFVELEKTLVAARGEATSQLAAAEKRFSAELAQSGASLSAGTQQIKTALVAAEKEEIDRVRARKVDPVAAQPRHHRHHRRHH